MTSQQPDLRHRLLMTGLPASGKTTYLAALWNQIRSATLGSEISLLEVPGDLVYLNNLTEAWLRCEQASHTSAGVMVEIGLRLRGRGDIPLEVLIPDYSGEFVRDAWTTRRWPGSLSESVRDANSAVLLVHPDHIVHVSIETVQRAAQALEAGPANPNLKAEPFDPSRVPTQTVLVDFLQFLRARSRAKRLPVALVVSAWDRVADGSTSPEDWISKNMPLLDQFLRATTDIAPFSVFGISAQGGAWPDAAATLLAVDPHVRPRVVTASGESHDVAAPLRWALEQG